MKKFLAIIFALYSTASLAKMVFDPVTCLVYSLPKSPNISQIEYNVLLLACVGIDLNLTEMLNGKSPSKKESLYEYSIFLRRIGTPTALRLLSDLEQGKLFYANGKVMRNLF